MASGYGLNGGPGRCFPFWQEVLGCYVVNASSEDPKGASKCGLALEDYYECLHHTKEKARVEKIQKAYRKALLADPREDHPSPDEIRSLGILNNEENTRKLLARQNATNGSASKK